MMSPLLLLASLLIAHGANAPSQDLAPRRVVPAPASAPMTPEAKQMFFRVYDRDADGFVSISEVNYARARPEGAPLPGPAYVAERDRNGDGRLDWAEFSAADTV